VLVHVQGSRHWDDTVMFLGGTVQHQNPPFRICATCCPYPGRDEKTSGSFSYGLLEDSRFRIFLGRFRPFQKTTRKRLGTFFVPLMLSRILPTRPPQLRFIHVNIHQLSRVQYTSFELDAVNMCSWMCISFRLVRPMPLARRAGCLRGCARRRPGA